MAARVSRRAAISIALIVSLALIPMAQADPPRSPAMKCAGGTLRSPPEFTQRPPGRAEYHFSGVCESRAGGFYGFFIDGTWTPNEPDRSNANASEIYHIVATSGVARTFDGVMGARCPNDPWLNEVACTRVGDNVPDELRALWPELVEPNVFPYTRRAIAHDQRAALRAEYARANGGASSLGDRMQRGKGLARPERDLARAADRKNVSTQRAAQSGVASLNPQPLPPKSIDAAHARALPTTAKGAEASIIIVSGKSGKPLLGKGAAGIVRKAVPATVARPRPADLATPEGGP